MSPEAPYLAAGTVAIIGGAIREQGWPPNVLKSIIGTVALTIAASTTANSRFAPLVHAIGLLLLLASIMAAVNAAIEAKKKPTLHSGADAGKIAAGIARAHSK